MNPANRLNDIQEYYFSHKLREVRDLIAAGKPIVNLGIGNPDLPPPSAVQKALLKAGASKTTHGYQPYKGIEQLRKAIALFYAKHYQVDLNHETEILPLTGSKEGVMHIAMAYLNAGDGVLIPNPGYTTYTSVTKLVGAKPIYYNLTEENNWLPNFDELEKLDLSKVKLMWINYPNMPTGANGNTEFFEKLIKFAKKHNILLINDNPYSFILTEKPLSILTVKGAMEVALELNSLSKSHNMAGWRVGMLLGAKKHIDNIQKIKSNMDSGMFLGLQAGGIAALEIEKKWYDELNKTYKIRREILWKIIDKLGYTYNKNNVGLFVWAKLPKNTKSVEITDYLLHKKHIFVTPGSIFGSNGEAYLRFSLCQSEEVLRDVLMRI